MSLFSYIARDKYKLFPIPGLAAAMCVKFRTSLRIKKAKLYRIIKMPLQQASSAGSNIFVKIGSKFRGTNTGPTPSRKKNTYNAPNHCTGKGSSLTLSLHPQWFHRINARACVSKAAVPNSTYFSVRTTFPLRRNTATVGTSWTICEITFTCNLRRSWFRRLVL